MMKKIEPINVNLKSDFITGTIVLLPIFATVWIVNLFIEILAEPVQLILGQAVSPILGFIISVFFITLIGVVARNFIGKAILSYVENLMNKIPVINTVYKALKQVVGSFSMQKESFAAVVLLEYPRKDIYALGFVTKEVASGMINKEGIDLVEGKCAVFVPTTPNPTSGFFLYLDRDELQFLDVSIEECIKTLMSAGVVSPQALPK